MAGDCFSVAVHAVIEDETLYVAHGYVTSRSPGGTAPVGMRHWHAWAEDEMTVDHPALPVPFVSVLCIDRSNGLDVTLPRTTYYALGSIDSGQVRRYTAAEVADAIRRFGHYGPWDDEHPPGCPETAGP